jgi:hypothetical protein
MMDILDQAMSIEKEGEVLYRQFSLEAPDDGMRTVFTWLADQERKHGEIFMEMKAGKSVAFSENTAPHINSGMSFPHALSGNLSQRTDPSSGGQGLVCILDPRLKHFRQTASADPS